MRSAIMKRKKNENEEKKKNLPGNIKNERILIFTNKDFKREKIVL